MAKKRLLTDDEASTALWECYGNAETAAQMMGVSARTMWRYMEQSDTVRQAAKDGRMRLVSVAQNALHGKILDGDIAAIIFTLKTLGKELGYSERHEVGVHISAELTMLMGKLGIDQRGLLREFETLVRQEAARLESGE